MRWELAAVVEVEHEDRVQCQCNGCGHVVFKRVHLMVWEDGRIECWGSDCFKREHAGSKNFDGVPSNGGSGRKLTPEERAMLTNNREQLVAQFRAERKRIEDERVAPKATQVVPRTEPRTPPKPPKYQGGEPIHDPAYMELRARLEQQWRENGIDPESHFGRSSLVANAMLQYERRPRNRSRY